MPRKKPARQTNQEFLAHLMSFSRHGALAEIFIMDAVAKHAKLVAAADPATLDSALLSGRAWSSVAKEIDAAFDERLK